MSTEFKDLLLQDYKYRVEAMGKSEAAGETRVNLFITLITISSGAIGALVTKSGLSANDLRAIAAVAFFSLLLIGFVTFMRMIVRNKNTDQCKHQLDLIRRTYQDQLDADGTWVDYELFPRRPKPEEGKGGPIADTKKNDVNEGIQARQFGGLPHTVAVLNSLLCAAMIAALSYPLFEDCVSLLVVLALLIVAATLAGQIAYLRNREKDTDAEMKRDFPRDTHAGGVVYKLENETALYLLVSSKNGGAATFLPRGHIDPGEGHAEAALREVCEETGVVARLRGLVGRAKFEVFDQKAQKNKTIRVKYFLMERLCDTVKEDEERNRSHAWLSYDKALEIMPSETGEILRKAEQLRLRKLHETKSTAAADVAKSG